MLTYEMRTYSRIQCANCIEIDLTEVFCSGRNRQKCEFFDPNTLESYYCDNIHPSRLGLTKMIPIISKAIDRSATPIINAKIK
jgi:protein-tyrosine phosphatase